MQITDTLALYTGLLQPWLCTDILSLKKHEQEWTRQATTWMDSNIYHLPKQFKLNPKNVKITLPTFMYRLVQIKQQLGYTILLYHPQEMSSYKLFLQLQNNLDSDVSLIPQKMIPLVIGTHPSQFFNPMALPHISTQCWRGVLTTQPQSCPLHSISLAEFHPPVQSCHYDSF